MKNTVILYLFTIIAVLLAPLDAGQPCSPRNYGKGGTVCVCNVTYCDTIDPIEPTARGVVTLYQSSKAGDRFRNSTFRFNTTETSNTTKIASILVNKTRQYQKIIGIGGSFTDAAGVVIASLPIGLQVQVMVDYFSMEGIEYTVGRVPIAGTDFSTRAYAYAEKPDDFNLTSFSLTDEDLIYKIPYLKMAEDLSPHEPKWFGSPWSPPAWMKTTGTLNNGGAIIGEPGGKYYQAFADYFVKFVNAYKSNSVRIWGLTVANEPDNGFKHLTAGRFNDIGLTQKTERDFVKLNLGPTLAKAGYGPANLSLIVYDGEKRSELFNWTDTIVGDKDAAKYVSGVGFHWYENTEANVGELDKTNAKYPNTFLISTEACDGWQKNVDHVSLGNWTRGERYAYDIITDLNHWTASWVDWNMVLNEEGGPNWTNNFVDAPIIANASAGEYYKQPLFYALGHFSKFLIPDSVRVESTVRSRVANLETTVFVRPDGGTVVIAVNLNTESVLLTVEEPTVGKFTRLVPAQTIQSYIWF